MAEVPRVTDRIARAVFGLLFETSADAVFVIDRTTQKIVSANLRAADMLQRDPGALVGMSVADLSLEPERCIAESGHYEEVGLKRGDDYPIYVELEVAHIDSDEFGALAAYMARDTSERRLLESELMAKHTALFAAHAELETRNREIALLAWRAAMGEVVAGIAHHLNNPIGALASTARRLGILGKQLPDEARAEHERLLVRVAQIANRIESNVSAIIQATRANADVRGRAELPPELATVLEKFVERIDHIGSKESS